MDKLAKSKEYWYHISCCKEKRYMKISNYVINFKAFERVVLNINKIGLVR